MLARAAMAILFVCTAAACGGGRPAESAPPPPPPPPPAPTSATAHEGHGGPLVHRFEKAEEWAPVFDDPARDAWQKPADVVAAMALEDAMVVADVGAGTGYFEPYLSRAVGPRGRVLARDIEPDMVRWLEARAKREGLANVEPALATGDDPKLPPHGVDRVLVVDTWHHIPAREAYARKLRDALRPGGRVFIVDFTMESKKGPPPAHRVPPEQVIRELGAAGLQAERLATPLVEQFVVATRP